MKTVRIFLSFVVLLMVYGVHAASSALDGNQLGKHVTIALPDCTRAMVAEIMFMGKGSFEKTLEFAPNKKSYEINIPEQIAFFVVTVLSKDTWLLEQQAKAEKNPKKRRELNLAVNKADKNVFQFDYHNIKPGQIINLRSPSAGQPDINQVRDDAAQNYSGQAFDRLPAVVKKSGKRVTLQLSSRSLSDMIVMVSQWVLLPSGSSKLLSQQVIISASVENITIDLAKAPTDKNMQTIDFHVMPLRLHEYLQRPADGQKAYNFNSELDRPGQPAAGVIRLMQALSVTASYDFDTLPSKVVLPNPMEMLQDVLGCRC